MRTRTPGGVAAGTDPHGSVSASRFAILYSHYDVHNYEQPNSDEDDLPRDTV